MSPLEQLPWDLVGEILCRVPTKSHARFRAVCKQWNAIWEDKYFLNKYLSRARPQFIVRTESEMCSVGINVDDDDDHVLSIEERDITLEYIPCKEYTRVVYCDGLVLFCMENKGFVIWNPWVRHKRFIENHEIVFCGMGYDNIRPETGYKIFGFKVYIDSCGQYSHSKFAIYECKSDAWKFINVTPEEKHSLLDDTIVSINGNLYFLAFDFNTIHLIIQSFDFSKEIFKTICDVPSIEGSSSTDALAVFRGDRLSLLMQSRLTNKVEIFVTKQKIDDGNNGEAIVWINFMTVSIPNLPTLQPGLLSARPSYFIDNNDDKRLFVCTSDENVDPCIYIVKGDVFKKISIDSVFDSEWATYISYIPSFVSIP